MTFTRLQDYLFALLQYVLPHHLLSRMMLAVTRIQSPFLLKFVLPRFIQHYKVDMSQAIEQDWRAYSSFNHFFTRALKPELRPITISNNIACPVDGCVSQSGKINTEQVFQAKGHHYTLLALLGGNPQLSHQFENGNFATLYLSPKDYHRIHMPVEGQLLQVIHVPGRLFSVNPATVRTIPNLFARNERVISIFQTESGFMAVIMVGALFVSSMETVWQGVVTPPAKSKIRRWDYSEQNKSIILQRGEELGRFNMGSTVILLFTQNAIQWENILSPAQKLNMGQAIGKFVTKN